MEWLSWNDATASLVLYSATAMMLFAPAWRLASGKKLPRSRQSVPFIGLPVALFFAALAYLLRCALRGERPRLRRRLPTPRGFGKAG